MKRKTANKYMSEYILLRDAIDDVESGRLQPDSLYEFVLCRTCGKPVARIGHDSQAGHFFPKGHGGSSGAYYAKENVNTQCFTCNEILEGNRYEYHKYMLKKYGQEVLDKLEKLHKLPRTHSIDEYGIMYREMLRELRKKHGLKR